MRDLLAFVYQTLQEELHRAQQVISKLENESLQNGEIVEQLAVIAGRFVLLDCSNLVTECTEYIHLGLFIYVFV